MTTTPPAMPSTSAPSDDSPPRGLRRLWGWFTLQNSAPEVDPLRSLSVTVAALATAVISYESLYNLALRVIGLHITSARLFPLAFDAVVFGATRVWLHPRLSDGTRRYAAYVAVFTIVASIIGNAVWHVSDGVANQVSIPRMIAVIGFSSLIPLVLALIIHMGSLIRRDRRGREVADAKAAAEAQQRAAEEAAEAQRAAEEAAARAARRQAKVVTPSVIESAPVPVQLEATGTDLATMLRPVTSITAPKDRIRDAIATHLAANRTVGGRGSDVSWADIDRQAATNTYAKKVGPGILEELQAVTSPEVTGGD
jgi:hypothetical protein